MKNFKLVVSPMAGVTDAPFRYIAIKHGADYGISEMVTSQTDLWKSNKTQFRLKSHFIEKPKIIQIAGASPDVIQNAALACVDQGADYLEINMGCPAKKVCNVLAGSALLRDEVLVASILEAAVKTVKIPVFLKTRLGWDHDNRNILSVAKIAEDCGISSLTIHGRTRSDMYNGNAQFDLIREVKQKISIPVFANGDITTPEKAFEVLSYTATNGLYIGRGALGKPWLFNQIKDYLVNGSYSNSISLSEILAIIDEHFRLIYQHYGEYIGVRFARKHFKWYLQASPEYFDADIFSNFSEILSANEQLEFIANLG